MSTKTNFKRIALVAVTALGLGVLSSVPSQAVINSDLLTLSATTATQTTAETLTASSATATFSFLGSANDSASVTASLVSSPAGNTALPFLSVTDSSSATTTTLSGLKVASNVALSLQDTSTTAAVVSFTARVFLTRDQTNGTTAPLVAGTYVVKLTPAVISAGSALSGSSAQTLTITVTTATTASTTVAAATSTAYMQTGVIDAKLAAQDSAILAVKTASAAAGTGVANIWLTAKNAASASPSNIESVTATITGAGTLGSHATVGSAVSIGRSIVIKPNTDYIVVFADGTSGVGTITLTGQTSGTLLSTKTVTFSGTVATKYAASTIASTDSSVIAVGGTTKVSFLAQDADSNLVSGLAGGTDFYAFSSETTVATVATYGAMSATTGYNILVTGVKAGTTQIIFGNASTLAASTIKSVAAVVRVGTSTPNSVTVTTDKASYAPGEKITLTVTILDSTGLAVVGATSYAGIFSSTGIVSGVTLSAGTLPATSAITDYSNTSNTKTYTVYAPLAGGPVTLSYTGGTGLATANQVAKTVTFSVTDSGAAALAAVTALATTVASLKTLITTLTNLVLKIQKKVKA